MAKQKEDVKPEVKAKDKLDAGNFTDNKEWAQAKGAK
jgi:hypothetical protein